MHEVRQQFNSGRDKNSIQSEPSIEDMAGIRRKNRQLFELKWYRVILDEAHVIKNKHSKSKLESLPKQNNANVLARQGGVLLPQR